MAEARQAFDDLAAFARSQRVRLQDGLVEDSMTLLRLEIRVADGDSAMVGIDHLRSHAEQIVLRFEGDVTHCEFTASDNGTWRADGDVDMLPGLTPQDGTEGYTGEALLAAWSQATHAVEVTVSVTLPKRQWSEPIGVATGAAVWVGPSLQGFARWLRARRAVNVLASLLSEGSALVLVGDWSASPCSLGGVLTIAGLDHRSLDRATALPEWPGPAEGWALRSLQVELSDTAPEDLRSRLCAIIGWAASHLVASEVADDQLRPDTHSPTIWSVSSHAQAEARGIEAIRALCRWVSEEANRTRLLVARRVAAARVDDPLNGPAAETVIHAAEISYQQLVDESVQEGLARQIELERSFRAIDSEMAGIKANLVTTVDQTVLRSLAGLLAIAAAAFAIEDRSGGLVWSGTALVVAYLFSTVVFQLRFIRVDAMERLEAFRGLLRSRGFQLDAVPVQDLDDWENALTRRIIWIRAGLSTLCAAVVAVSLVATR